MLTGNSYYLPLFISSLRSMVLAFLSFESNGKLFGRMKGKKGKELREAKKELEQSISLVKAPSVLREDQSLTLPVKVKVQVNQKQAEAQPMEE